MRDPPDAAVVRWLNDQAPERVWTTAVTAFEVRFGLARMAEGRKRRALEEATFSVPRGAMLGVVGPNGGGKSTLFSLIQRFYAAELTAWDRLRIVSGKPPVPVGEALRALAASNLHKDRR